ncbi:manganese efflux pump [Psychrobacillus sp. NPDC058041]|uniref:manganese efflux pump n=1 Tax=Psychrobacillus sp. NPDC058041 TaxID=3346310 RepID=UPI0036DE9150
MVLLVILAFAVSSSIDNLAVGISYGIREIHIGVVKNFLIAIICFLMSMAGISFGIWLSSFLPGVLPVIVGAFLLFVIGIRIILLARSSNSGAIKTDTKSNNLGIIGWGESIFLGIALSANALTNGLSAGLLGFSPLAISATAAIGSYISIWIGVKLGVKLSSVRIGKFTVGQFGSVLSGAIIIVIAVTSFF